jgi:hypothetical protein
VVRKPKPAASILFSLALILLTFILFSCILILFTRVYLASDACFCGATGPNIKDGTLRVGDNLPAWLEYLDDEDLQFLKRFLLFSGSLKALADEYGISYPTVRGRLDRLIAKVRAAEEPKISDPFQRRLRVLVADAQISPAVGKELLEAYRASMKGGKNND